MMVFKRGSALGKGISLLVAVTFVGSLFMADFLRVSSTQASVLGLPEPTTLLRQSQDYSSPILKGLKLDINNPLNIDFIVDVEDQKDIDKKEAAKLIRYFLAALTIPEKDLWVNLSPYEDNRIVPRSLGETDLGKELLEQDYILKQLSSSLTHPDSKLGKEYWAIRTQRGTRESPLQNNFDKIWVVPGDIEVWEHENVALINYAELEAQTEADYLAMQSYVGEDLASSRIHEAANKTGRTQGAPLQELNPVEDVLLPAIVDELNNGKHFSELRQAYSSIVLAMWFKQKFKQSFYKHYFDQAKINGIDLEDKDVKQKIYSLYTEAFEKGVYDLIQKVQDDSGQKSNRRYFSGGMSLTQSSEAVSSGVQQVSLEQLSASMTDLKVVSSNVELEKQSIEEMDRINAENWEDFKLGIKSNHVKYALMLAGDASKLGLMNRFFGRTATTIMAGFMRDTIAEVLYENRDLMVGKRPKAGSDELKVAFLLTEEEYEDVDALEKKQSWFTAQINTKIEEKMKDYVFVDIDFNQPEIQNRKIKSKVRRMMRVEKMKSLVQREETKNNFAAYDTKDGATLMLKKGTEVYDRFIQKLGLIPIQPEIVEEGYPYLESMFVPYMYVGSQSVSFDSSADYDSKLNQMVKALKNADAELEFNKNNHLEESTFDSLYDEFEDGKDKFENESPPLPAEDNFDEDYLNRIDQLERINKRRKERGLSQIIIDKDVGLVSRESFTQLLVEIQQDTTRFVNKPIVARSAPNEFHIAYIDKEKGLRVMTIDSMYYNEEAIEKDGKIEYVPKSLPDTGREIQDPIYRRLVNKFNQIFELVGNVMLRSFKSVNTVYGHDNADEYLRIIATVLSRGAGKDDLEIMAEEINRYTAKAQPGNNKLRLAFVASQLSFSILTSENKAIQKKRDLALSNLGRDNIFLAQATVMMDLLKDMNTYRDGEGRILKDSKGKTVVVYKNDSYMRQRGAYEKLLKIKSIEDSAARFEIGPKIREAAEKNKKRMENTLAVAKDLKKEEVFATASSSLTEYLEDNVEKVIKASRKLTPTSGKGNAFIHINKNDHIREWNSFGSKDSRRGKIRYEENKRYWQRVAGNHPEYAGIIRSALLLSDNSVENNYYNVQWYLHLLKEEEKIDQESYDKILRIYSNRYKIVDQAQLDREKEFLNKMRTIEKHLNLSNLEFIIETTLAPLGEEKIASIRNNLDFDLLARNISLVAIKSTFGRFITDVGMLESLAQQISLTNMNNFWINNILDKIDGALGIDSRNAAYMVYEEAFANRKVIKSMIDQRWNESGEFKISFEEGVTRLLALPEDDPGRSILQMYAILNKLIETFKHQRYISFNNQISKEAAVPLDQTQEDLQDHEVDKIKEYINGREFPNSWIIIKPSIIKMIKNNHYRLSNALASVFYLFDRVDRIDQEQNLKLTSVQAEVVKNLKGIESKELDRLQAFLLNLYEDVVSGVKNGGESIVLVSQGDMLPSEIYYYMKKFELSGVVSTAGPDTHLGVVALKAMLPSVFGVSRDDIKRIKPGEMLGLFGSEGLLVKGLRPDGEKFLDEEQKEYKRYYNAVYKWYKNSDDRVVELSNGSHIGLVQEIDEAKELAGDPIHKRGGIGDVKYAWIRSEMEKEPLNKILDKLGGNKLVYRLFDRQQDKDSEFSNLSYDADNLGFSFYRRPEGKKKVLKQMVEVMNKTLDRPNANVHFLFPDVSMVADVEYMADLFSIASRSVLDARIEGYMIKNDEQISESDLNNMMDKLSEIEMRIMIENVSGVSNVRNILRSVKDNFKKSAVHVGTNDLYYNILGVSRNDPKSAEKMAANYPVFVEYLYKISRAAAREGLAVTFCGNFTSDDRMSVIALFIASQIKDLELNLAVSNLRVPFAAHFNKFHGENIESMNDVMENIFDFAEDEIPQANVLNGVLNQFILFAKNSLNLESSSLGQDSEVGGMDFQGIDINTTGSSAIELAPFDLKDFRGFTFSISSIEDIDSKETALAFLSQ